MTKRRDLAHVLLEVIPPPDPSPYRDWDDVLQRSGIARRNVIKTHGHRTTDSPGTGHSAIRRWLIPAAVAASLLIGGGAYAAISGVPWWQSGAPPVNPAVVDQQLAAPVNGRLFPPPADRSRARTVAQVGDAALVAAPVATTGYCVIPSLPGTRISDFSACTTSRTLLMGLVIYP